MTQPMELAAKSRKEKPEEDRLAASQAEERKRATARAQQEAIQARIAFAEQQQRVRIDLERQRAALSHAEHVQRWLQTQYPAAFAERVIGWYSSSIRKIDRERYTRS